MNTTVVAIAAFLLLGGGIAHGAATCETELFKAAARYTACEQKAVATKVYGVAPSEYPFPAYQVAAAKCRTKYATNWAKLQNKFQGDSSQCDGPRFENLGSGIVRDNLTHLEWSEAAVTGVAFNWSATGTLADGFTFNILAGLFNQNPGVAGARDWRVPSRTELQTILKPGPFPCESTPCVDPAFVFVTTFIDCDVPFVGNQEFWTATSTISPYGAWTVNVCNGEVIDVVKTRPSRLLAVHGGL